jgi:arylsulfatase A-like enzyme
MQARARSVAASVLVVLMAALATATLSAGSSATDPGGTAAVVSASVPEAVARPNIVFVMTDDMRVDDLAHMPLTQRLVGDAGMTFEDGISPHPLCCPARAELATGQYAQNNGVQHNRGPFGGFSALDPGREASAWFRDAGYQTGFVGKYLNGYGPEDTRPAGWTRWDALQTGTYDYLDFSMSGNGVRETYDDSYVTDVISRHTDRTVRHFAQAGRPFVVYSWHLAPHYRISNGRRPPPAAPKDRGRFRDARPPSLDDAAYDEDDVSDQPRYLRHLPRVDRDAIVREHRARLRSLQAVDRAVASLVDTLAEEGVLDHTYIVFTSDNGYSLGEHRFVGKDVLTEEALRVPLLVRGPGVPAGAASDLPVSLVDLPATFADLADVSPGWVVDGTSLAPTLHGGDQPFRDTTLVQTGSAAEDGWSHRGVRTERYLYGVDGTDGFLYDMQLDPDQLVNRHDDPAYASVRAALERRRTALVGCAGWTCNQVFGPLPEPQDLTVPLGGPGSR